MIYVALIEAVALIVTGLSFAGVVRSLVRQQARERDLLLNQIMHLSGHTWTPPPAHDPRPAPEPRETERNFDMLPDWERAEL